VSASAPAMSSASAKRPAPHASAASARLTKDNQPDACGLPSPPGPPRLALSERCLSVFDPTGPPRAPS
jgi:hypothetical protein